MSKDTLIAILAASALTLFVVFFGTINPFEQPAPASESVIPLGSFDGSGGFADSLTATSSLLASPAAATNSGSGSLTGNRTKTPTPAGLPEALGSLRDSLVNIVCAARDGSVRSISGSGVTISPEGLIITNAHIAQLFLLKDYPSAGNVICVVRTGNPARTAYFAELVYISKPWITKYPTTLIDKNPTGTGENDFALLAITKTATATALPETFPYVPLATGEPRENQPVSIGSYGAQALTNTQIRDSLYPTLVFGAIQDRFTFERTSIDLLSLGGSAVAQHGSSGGGVVNQKGELIAVISTSSVEGALLERDLRAITVSHIRRSYTADTGKSIDDTVASTDILNLISSFAASAKPLQTTLTGALSKKK